MHYVDSYSNEIARFRVACERGDKQYCELKLQAQQDRDHRREGNAAAVLGIMGLMRVVP